jgi:hypothetical protein
MIGLPREKAQEETDSLSKGCGFPDVQSLRALDPFALKTLGGNGRVLPLPPAAPISVKK